MKASVEVKADILKAMLAEDRQEVRRSQALIYSVMSGFIIAALTLTSIFVKPETAANPIQMQKTIHAVYWIDILILPVIWITFLIMKRDVTNAQKCVRLRQRMIHELDDSITPYPDLDMTPPATEPPDIKHRHLWWVPILATFVIGLQALFFWLAYS